MRESPVLLKQEIIELAIWKYFSNSKDCFDLIIEPDQIGE